MRMLIQSMLAGSLSAALWALPASAEAPVAGNNASLTAVNNGQITDSNAVLNNSAAPESGAVPNNSAVINNSPATGSSAAPIMRTAVDGNTTLNNSAAPGSNAVINNSPATVSSAAPIMRTATDGDTTLNNSAAPGSNAVINNSPVPDSSAAPIMRTAPDSNTTPNNSPAPDSNAGLNNSAAPAASTGAENPAVSTSTHEAASGSAMPNGGTAAAPSASSPATVTHDSSALSSVPPPAGLDNAEPALEAAAGATPYAPGQATATAMASSMLNQPVSSTLSVAQMGQRQGITLTGGQLQSGILFTLPGDEVVTNARLNLSLRVSQALAARNTSLQLMLNGQPLGTLPLGSGDSDESDYQLDIPAAMIVSNNNLSFKINDADKLLCEKDSAEQYQVTILPKTMLSLEGQQLNIGTSLRNFPRPFIDPQRMTAADVTFAFTNSVSPDTVTAAVLVASWLGIQSDYRGISFPVVRGTLPEKNGILFGHPGDKIGTLTFPASSGPTLQMVDNPGNPVYKLLLVSGADENQLRQAANRLTTQPLTTDGSMLQVKPQSIASRSPYDAPRWINTLHPVRLGQLLRKDQSLTATGIWHDAMRVNFRAAPDLFLWDGDTVPLHLHYRFPSETWIDEKNSLLNVTLNGTFLRNLTVNKEGLLESVWHRLGGDARQEHYQINLDPYLIYGDNQLALYFNIKPKADAPCGVLLNNNIKSRIEEDSWIDLSHTRHFSMLPNLSYFVGASFPFSRLADFSQTTLLLPGQPSDAEISTLLNLSARAGNATGVVLAQNQVLFGLPNGGNNLARVQQTDLLAVSTTGNSAFNQAMLENSPYDANGSALGVKEPTTLEKLRSWLMGDWYRQPLDADRYFSSNESWRGFLSYRSTWNPDRLVVMAVATSDDQLLRLHGDLSSARINAAVRGDTAIITDENGIRSFRVGPQFPSGEMPWYMMVVWYANQHSVLMALAALLFSAVVGSAAWAMLKRHASRRLQANDNRDAGKK
ncbi:cellulose biosynthesis cyclic di-GMP-binding regulatory protein BcsB [Pantoea stewartii]|uniref:cellulose biosynthesis cyclic di-GMP-binding regulatory protein BcsB n=1 Tax=Pantoea stewartii TaxID=66269 RepID=UPI0016257EEA|nr:cellulose biosynthesis cyclic di-GMP-binding regulatory protein BcsB [Pantoea stewartii]MBC0855844.1 cellulose biosynthesis cyclic di-GMP-binding regulatory protein BcsB [Pantoea stewartii]